MFESLKSATPEQKLYTLIAELKTPVEIIRGFAYIIKKDIETNNIDTAKMLEAINKIAEKTNYIKEICDEIAKS